MIVQQLQYCISIDSSTVRSVRWSDATSCRTIYVRRRALVDLLFNRDHSHRLCVYRTTKGLYIALYHIVVEASIYVLCCACLRLKVNRCVFKIFIEKTQCVCFTFNHNVYVFVTSKREMNVQITLK